MQMKNAGFHAATGTPGLDDILSGGLPRGKPSMLTGRPGTGKTLFSMSFACQGTREGAGVVYVSFEEHPDMLQRHARFLGHELDGADALRLLDMRVGHEELAATGNLELAPVRARIQHAVSEVDAGRLVLDSIDSLFFVFGARASTQLELLRLLDWAREQGITAILTGNNTVSDEQLGLIPHVCDCVMELDQEIQNNVMTRRLRVRKFRGSSHGTNLYPFIIDKDGIFVLPITSTRLDSPARGAGISTGIEILDEMLAGTGIRGGSVAQISGRTGTGKTLLAASIVRSACDAGNRVLYVSFEESARELLDNVASPGIDLSSQFSDADASVDGPLQIEATRAAELSLEGHLVNLIRLVERRQPDLLVLDPVSSLREQGSLNEAKAAIVRLVNHVKSLGKTMLFTELLPDDTGESSTMNISSIVDTWIRLRMTESHGEFTRLIHVAKSRGIAASNQVREFHISSRGLNIETPYMGPGEMVVGTAKKIRERQEAREKARAEQQLAIVRRQLSIRERMAELRRELEGSEQQQELEALKHEIETLEDQLSNQSDNQEFTRRKRLGEAQGT